MQIADWQMRQLDTQLIYTKKMQESKISPRLYIVILHCCTSRRLYRNAVLFCLYHAIHFLRIVENAYTVHCIIWKPVCNQEIKDDCKANAVGGGIGAAREM